MHIVIRCLNISYRHDILIISKNSLGCCRQVVSATLPLMKKLAIADSAEGASETFMIGILKCECEVF